MMNGISTKQAQALRLTCTKTLGMSEEDYKEMLRGYGVTSARQLAPLQFNGLMAQLRGQKPRQGSQLRPGWDPPADKQLGLIYHLWGELYQEGKVQHRENAACLHWMRKYLRQPDGTIEFTPQQKSRSIECLKAWLERE